METIEIELTRIFVKVVQQGGFSKAAALLKIPKSTVSKAITKLESMTGTKLLLRTTRSHTLTAAGRVFYETCLEPIQVLEDAQKSLAGLDTIASGHIKLTAPEDLGTYVISPIIGELRQRYPSLTFDLHFSNELIDLVRDGFDLAVRIGELDASQLKARRISHIEMIPVASPSYLSTHKKIRHPVDLKDHECLGLRNAQLSRVWIFRNDGKPVKIAVRSQVESNQMTGLLQVAVSGAGVLLAPSFLCRPEIEKGSLKRILSGWSGVRLPVSILSPVSVSATARLKLVSDRLSAALQQELERPL